jgi:hypothetical protein
MTKHYTTKPKFNVGDKVTIVDTSVWGESTIGEMRNLIGNTAMITDNNLDFYGGYTLDIDDGQFIWDEKDLEAIL